MANFLFEGAVSLELELLYISGCTDTVTEQRLYGLLEQYFPPCTPVIRENDLATALRTLGVLPEKLRAMLKQGRDASCKVTAAIVEGPHAVHERQNELCVGQSDQSEMHKICTLMTVTAAIERLAHEQEERESRLKRLAGIEEEKLSNLGTLARDERELQERLAMLSKIAQHYKSLVVHDERREAFQRVESEAKLFEDEASDS